MPPCKLLRLLVFGCGSRSTMPLQYLKSCGLGTLMSRTGSVERCGSKAPCAQTGSAMHVHCCAHSSCRPSAMACMPRLPSQCANRWTLHNVRRCNLKHSMGPAPAPPQRAHATRTRACRQARDPRTTRPRWSSFASKTSRTGRQSLTLTRCTTCSKTSRGRHPQIGRRHRRAIPAAACEHSY